MNFDNDESERDSPQSEIYRVTVRDDRPILFGNPDVGQTYAEDRLGDDFDVVEWQFDGDDMDLMHGVVEGPDGQDVSAAKLKREQVFHDVETAGKWRQKRERKEANREIESIEHSGSEPWYRCLFCNETHPGRGMKNHVRFTGGSGHGPRGEVPDDYDLDRCECVNEGEDDE